MKVRTLKRLVVFLLLIISLALLVWGLWPGMEITRVMPISPQDMQMPMPAGWLLPAWLSG